MCVWGGGPFGLFFLKEKKKIRKRTRLFMSEISDCISGFGVSVLQVFLVFWAGWKSQGKGEEGGSGLEWEWTGPDCYVLT
jgi:hypothetical protein